MFRRAILLLVLSEAMGFGCLGCTSGSRSNDSPQKTSPTHSEQESDSTATVPDEPESPFTLEEGFTLLSFDDFQAFGAEEGTWKKTDSGLSSTGKPKGYLYSNDMYDDFTLRLDYRFDRPKRLDDESKFKGNTGFLIYISGEHKLWPVCLEVQGKHVQMGAIKENGGAEPVVVADDETARTKARKPVGNWNQIEITSKQGSLTVLLNGSQLSHSEPSAMKQGLIGIQAEDHPFEIRHIRIRRDSRP